jgi:hypothetical protein
MIQRTSTILAFAVLAAACTKKDAGGADAAASASASASSAPTAEAPKPNPPADADKSCTPTPTKIEADKEGIAIDYTVKNTGAEPWHYCHVNAFGYDKSGKLVARGMLSDNISLAPGAGHDTSLHVTKADDGKPLDMATALTLSYELLPGRIIWDDKSEWENKNGGFDHKAATGPTVTFNKDGSVVGGAKTAASASAAKPATTAAAKASAAPAKTPPAKH